MNKKEELLTFLEEMIGVKRINQSSIGKIYKPEGDEALEELGALGLFVKINKKKVFYYVIDSKQGGRCYLSGNLKDFDGSGLGFLKEVSDKKVAKRKDFSKIVEKLSKI